MERHEEEAVYLLKWGKKRTQPPAFDGWVRETTALRSCKRATGFEPATFSLARRRSTTEPHPRISARLINADEQSRTVDPTIFSRVLYQLSYVGVGRKPLKPPWFEQRNFTGDRRIVKR